jgi:UDP-N-acetylglucosamine 4,6-dehydratase
VISLFKEQLKNGGVAKITDERMTRFWIKIQDAAKFIISAVRSNAPGIHIPDMKASHVTKVADAILSEMQGVDCEARYDVIGMRPGEKINECLKSRYEEVYGPDSVYDVYSDRVTQFSLQEMRELVRGEL